MADSPQDPPGPSSKATRALLSPLPLAFAANEGVLMEREALEAMFGDDYKWDEARHCFEIMIKLVTERMASDVEQADASASARAAVAIAKTRELEAARCMGAATRAKAEASESTREAQREEKKRLSDVARWRQRRAEEAVKEAEAAQAAAAAAVAAAATIAAGEARAALTLRVYPTSAYPEAAPMVEVCAHRGGLCDTLIRQCEELVQSAAQGDKLRNYPMVYELFQLAHEWLVDHDVPPPADLYTEMVVAHEAGRNEGACIEVDVPLACEISADAASTGCFCVVCFDELAEDDPTAGLVCSAGHSLCADCVNGQINAMQGSEELKQRCGGLPCLAYDASESAKPLRDRPTLFPRSRVEALLVQDSLRFYRETLNALGEASTSARGTACEAERVPPDLYNITCPSCERPQDPNPDGCIAMVCAHCHVAYCWLCFQPCGRDAHEHCRVVHPPTYFPSRRTISQWHARWRWHKVQSHLLRLGEPLRAPSLALSKVDLQDVLLWPFPDEAPVVSADKVPPMIAAAVAGAMAVLEQALDAGSHVDEADERGMTALMHACHTGRHEVAVWLLEQGASPYARDHNGRGCLFFAQRSQSVEVVPALLQACPWICDRRML
eukprot:TRINITY_DN25883_c0_g1_i1.p1 TRINITY_DN25883_c0_g1~~TRINITY_DN25883_c0_g1_i1.p1  ORF type:complete len:671 (+),score=91.43 TRINITY_DN25883_c0_g1_i1:178-2013(+)